MPFVCSEAMTVEYEGAEFRFRWPTTAVRNAISKAMLEPPEDDPDAGERMVLDLLVGWSELIGCDGKPLAFSAEAIGQIPPPHRTALVGVWLSAIDEVLWGKKLIAAASGIDSVLLANSEAESAA